MEKQNCTIWEKNIQPNLKENIKTIIHQKTQEECRDLRESILQDQKVYQSIWYLSTFARLEEQDIDNLFDGDTVLWEEELLAIYSLLDILNGNNQINSLENPSQMKLNINWERDWNYDVKFTENNRLQSVTGSQDYNFLTTSTLEFLYNESWDQIEQVWFQRAGARFDQNMKIQRTENKVTLIELNRTWEIDNSLSITYNQIGKPEILEQTKFWLTSDKTIFEYDEEGNLKSIIYMPALSLKHFTSAWRTIKNNSKLFKWIMIAGKELLFEEIKRLKWVDVIEITQQNWLISQTQSSLKASNWFYTEWDSQANIWKNWEFHINMRRDSPFVDDEKIITVK